MLGDLNDEQFIRGIKTFCLAHKEIYPNTNVIAHIRDYALTDPNQKTASEAWEEVLAVIHNVGSWGSPKFSDPIIGRAVNAVGWQSMCQSETIGVERAHFMRAYEDILEREKMKAMVNF